MTPLLIQKKWQGLQHTALPEPLSLVGSQAFALLCHAIELAPTPLALLGQSAQLLDHPWHLIAHSAAWQQQYVQLKMGPEDCISALSQPVLQAISQHAVDTRQPITHIQCFTSPQDLKTTHTMRWQCQCLPEHTLEEAHLVLVTMTCLDSTLNAQKEAKHWQSRYYQWFDHCPYGVIVTDFQGVILEGNLAFRQRFSADYMLQPLLSPASQKLFTQVLQQRDALETPRSLILTLESGETVTVHAMALQTDGKPAAICWMF